MTKIDSFKQNLIESGVLDAPDIHHEFVSGKHGRKLDFDKIETGSELYSEWVDVNEDYIRSEFTETPAVIVGVANGTNRLALDVSRRYDGRTLGLISSKDPENSKRLYLPKLTEEVIKGLLPRFVVVVEDVGTTGSNSVQIAKAVEELGVPEVVVVPTWQRQPALEKLDEADIAYRSIINHTLATYSPEECLESGFCSQGIELVPRS